MIDVLQVNKLYYPTIGGIENHVRMVAENLDSTRFAVRVLAAMESGRGGRERIHGIPVSKTTSLGTALSVPFAPTFPLRLREASGEVDIVHQHLPNPLGVTSGLLTDRETRTICTYHSDIVKQRLELKAYEPLLHRFLDRVDTILVTSPRLLDYSRHLESYREKCEVVPLAIDTDSYGSYSGPDYALVDGSRPVILFVGRLNYYKGVEYLVDAMSDVDATLLVVGDGARADSLAERASERGVTSKIQFLGQVSDECLHYCYDVSDLFVLPSVERSEAFGIVQLEAMAYGLPVVNTNLPTGVPWVSQDGETGLTVPPRDSEALATALETLVDDKERRVAYGRQARQRVERLFNIDRLVDDIGTIYERLAAK